MDQSERATFESASQLRVLAAVLTKCSRRDLEQRLEQAQCDLSALAHGVLRMLQGESQTISEISRKMNLAPTTLVPVIDGLERRDLVHREQDPHDRRRTPIVLTPAGAQIVAQVPVLDRDDTLVCALASLNEQEQIQLLELLRRVVAGLPHGSDVLQRLSVESNQQSDS